MDDGKNNPGSDSESRPSTAHTVFRRVPGSFDDAGISPMKEDFDIHYQPTQPSANATALKPETMLPPLQQPPPSTAADVSFAENTSLDDLRHSDSQAEIAVRQHLQDFESSFAAPPSPIPTSANGIDDTYLFDSPSKKPQPAATSQTPSISLDSQDESQELPAPNRTPSAASQTPCPRPAVPPAPDHDTTSTNSSNTSALEAFSSSPTATATARTVSRALSRASAKRSDNEDDENDARDAGDAAEESSWGNDRKSYQAAFDEDLSYLHPSSGAPRTMRHMSSDQSLRKAGLDAGSTPGHALRAGKRPKYLRSRNGSQRSSVSSFNTDPESDVTVGLGTDYALQSGGALPTLGLSRSTSNVLSRTVSMGSMASGIDDFHDSSGPNLGFGHLETLDESPRRPTAHRPDEDNLHTPKAERNPASLTAPTDTVIARHVKNVHVPESLAREYKTKNGLITPVRKPSDFSTVSGAGPPTTSRHGGKNLTLKEQSSTIERLSKENFDLKLKVMFLSDRLDKLSEEGVKEMISENVELKTGLAVLQRDNKVLRRRVKELERQAKDEDERPGTARSGFSEDDQSGPTYDPEAQEREEEVVFLRERMEEYVTEIERLRAENLTKENEKRRMAEFVKSMGDKTGESLGRQEETDVWKDLLEQETARREQADDDNRRLRDEVFRLKQEMSSLTGGLHHTTNIYNITKKRDRPASPSRPVSSFSGEMDSNGVALSATSTLVEELRRESEQLRHENAELRREVGAQTSMLTSRNREKERLYQEIEDLKMAQRRGGAAPSTVDSILERSASRAGAHERSHSRTSAGTRATGTALDDAERDELEGKMAEMRDKNNELKLHNQDLQRELDACMDDFEAAIEGKKQAEELVGALQEDIDTAMNDLVALQAERDEALQEHANLEAEFEALRKEAQEEIDALEGEADQRTDEIQRLQLELNDRSENFDALQEEMRRMSEALVRLEDEQDNKLRRIQQLEHELGEANKELEELETKLLESNDKANRLSVQQESSQGEIAFLREEQEGDKIRIGDLEAAIANAEQSLREEKDRTRELDQRLATERRQREIVATREKEEVQQFVNELNREASGAKDEVRKLRKNLRSREVEATEWKERLMELENNLREALGDLNGTRSSLLKSIAKLQRELEDTVRELDSTKASLMEKDRIIKQRDSLLETHGLESRKLAEMLDKERQAHRNTKHQFETFQKTHQHVTRTVSSQDSRIMELENAKVHDKKRIAQLETDFKEQLTERNNLLLLLWTRLSSLCGTDWAHGNSLINGRALPSLEAVTTMLPGFSKNLMAAIRTIEAMMGGFQGKIKNVEKDLWREYQTLESHLEMRTKKLDRLEAIVRNGVAAGALGLGGDQLAKLARLEEEYRRLKIENHTLRTAADVRARSGYGTAGGGGDLNDEIVAGSPSPSIPTGPRDRGRDRVGGASRIPKSGSRGGNNSRPGTMSRATSSHGGVNLAAEELGLAEAGDEGQNAGGGGSMETKWMIRLKDLEYKIKAEREARVLDRAEAMKRISASENENQVLRDNLEREKRRQGR